MQNFDKIDEMRERLGIAQKDLCERADVHVSSYSRYKAAGREPTARIRSKLLRALDGIAAERGVAIVEEGRR